MYFNTDSISESTIPLFITDVPQRRAKRQSRQVELTATLGCNDGKHYKRCLSWDCRSRDETVRRLREFACALLQWAEAFERCFTPWNVAI